MFDRYLKTQLVNSLNENMIVIIYGARQVGKTTLAKEIMSRYKNSLYINADETVERLRLQNRSSREIKDYFGDAELVVIDEAQRIENIGLTAKLVHDTYPEVRLLLTGSSSLDLASKIKEPLTGRSVEYTLYPLSLDELATTNQEKEAAMKRALIYGSYPGIWQLSYDKAAQQLRALATNYIYRDAFALQTIFDGTVMYELLQLLAFQIGNEVSYNELATTLNISRETAMRYVDLLEKARIIYRLRQYRRNERVVIGKLRKIYFYDLGVRNGLVDNFKDLTVRDDKGGLWENFCINERLKKQQELQRYTRQFYWRNRAKQEIDLIEEHAGNISAFEFKYTSAKKVNVPKSFQESYPGVGITVLNRDNFISELSREYGNQKQNRSLGRNIDKPRNLAKSVTVE